MIEVFYGEKYAGTAMVTAVLGLTCGVRFVRLVPAIAAIATADGMNQLFSNIWRGASLPLVFLAVFLGGGLVQFAICGLVAETCAAAFSFIRFSRRSGLGFGDYRAPLLLMLLCFMGSFVVATLGIHWTVLSAGGTFATIIAACFGLARILLPATFALLRSASSMALLSARTKLRPA